MIDDKIIQLAKKLHALAEQGDGGEKENALEMLQRLIQKHGITLESIIGEAKHRRNFVIKTTQHKFFFQVVASVLGQDYSYYQSKSNIRKIGLCLSDAEFIEIQAKFDFYVVAYEKDLKLFYRAFIHRNKLYAKQHENNQQSSKEQKPELTEDDLKIIYMMQGLKAHAFHKRLTH